MEKISEQKKGQKKQSTQAQTYRLDTKVNTERLHIWEDLWISQGRLFDRETYYSIVYNVIKEWSPRRDLNGLISKRVTKKLHNNIYKVITQLIWETIIEGHEFVMPNNITSFVIIEVPYKYLGRKKKLYQTLFYQGRALMVEQRVIKRRTTKKYTVYRGGYLSHKGIREANKRMEDGLRYNKRHQQYIDI